MRRTGVAAHETHRRRNTSVDLSIIAQAVGIFAGTNIDDTLVLALFFGQAAGRGSAEIRVVVGQYIGFGIILLASVVGALGAARLLPEQALPYLGLLPLVLGIRAAVIAWLHHHTEDDESKGASQLGPTTWAVAGITLANGGDNVGVYIPVFATTGVGGMVVYCAVFLILLAGLIALGRFFATRKPVARAIASWGHIILPIVLIGIGLAILIEGGAFGVPTIGH
jgi:cadmium resistance protein CadD (predicted permease)